MFKLVITSALAILTLQVFSQNNPINSKDFLNTSINTCLNTCIPNTTKNLEILKKDNIKIKYTTDKWIYINVNSKWIKDNFQKGKLNSFYYEFSNPQALTDSAIVRHKINLVHQGNNLDTSYTGKGVIVGIVDQGIDYNHPDFKFSNGKTRVLRYWDHTVNGGLAPQPYNYGVVWDSSAINNGTCTSLENGTTHGTNVSGMATGNGRANNKNKGVAPEADIIVVETNFNLPNWTLTIADACDYIFKVADSLGKPAVINLSLGTYLGSHDGKDPASEYIESLLTNKEGRIVVCAAGNAGAMGKFHVNGIVDQDTSFFWNLNNSGTTYVGTNKILFDLWADTSEADINFAFGADLPAPSYEFRGRTTFHNFYENSSSFPMIYDTLYSSNGDRLACIETFREIEGANFHMQVIFRTIDSLNYNYRFETFGNGKYDVWGGSWQKMSDFQTTIPSISELPAIAHYHMPDTLQSIVSSWNCSDKVISVGNIRNRQGYIDKNNTPYYPTWSYAVGQLSTSSSKGPSRNGNIKPDVVASGDLSLASAPMWFLSNSANNGSIDQGGFHARNGGTSMASPVVAGIAALYLQKCTKASFSDFKTDLTGTANADFQTGITPNYAYGFGKVNAHETLLQKHYPISISGPSGICAGQTISLSYNSPIVPITAQWSNGAISPTINTSIPGQYSITFTDNLGCRSKGIKSLVSFPLPFVDAGANRIICPGTTITLAGTGQASTYIWNNNVQNNVAFKPTKSGYYKVIGIDINGCSTTDSTFLDFYTVQPVSYNESVTSIGTQDLAFNVTQGIPSGGYFSGNGIIGTSFHPGLAGIGNHYIVYSIIDANGCVSSDSSLIQVYNNIGLNELTNSVKIFPNPTSEKLTIQTDEIIELSCYSIDGKKIEVFTVEKELIIDTTSYSNGLYFLMSNNLSQQKPIYFMKN